MADILTLTGLLAAASARGESVAARPSGRAHLYAGRTTAGGMGRPARGARPVCGTRTRQLRAVVGRPKPCRRCAALLARTGTVPTIPASRAGLRAAWADLTSTDLWLSYLMAETDDERDACVWLTGLLFDELRPIEAHDPAGHIRHLAEFRAGIDRARADLAVVSRIALTDEEDTAEVDELLAEQDAIEAEAAKRRHRGWDRSRAT